MATRLNTQRDKEATAEAAEVVDAGAPVVEEAEGEPEVLPEGVPVEEPGALEKVRN